MMNFWLRTPLPSYHVYRFSLDFLFILYQNLLPFANMDPNIVFPNFTFNFKWIIFQITKNINFCKPNTKMFYSRIIFRTKKYIQTWFCFSVVFTTGRWKTETVLAENYEVLVENKNILLTTSRRLFKENIFQSTNKKISIFCKLV